MLTNAKKGKLRVKVLRRRKRRRPILSLEAAMPQVASIKKLGKVSNTILSVLDDPRKFLEKSIPDFLKN